MLAFCAGNHQLREDHHLPARWIPHTASIRRSFGVFFAVSLNNLLDNQSRLRWHLCDVAFIIYVNYSIYFRITNHFKTYYMQAYLGMGAWKILRLSYQYFRSHILIRSIHNSNTASKRPFPWEALTFFIASHDLYIMHFRHSSQVNRPSRKNFSICMWAAAGMHVGIGVAINRPRGHVIFYFAALPGGFIHGHVYNWNVMQMQHKRTPS